jgi:hypothetical protein
MSFNIYRGSLPPAICVAWYQSDQIAETYSTLGYLVPIISVLSIVGITPDFLRCFVPESVLPFSRSLPFLK